MGSNLRPTKIYDKNHTGPFLMFSGEEWKEVFVHCIMNGYAFISVKDEETPRSVSLWKVFCATDRPEPAGGWVNIYKTGMGDLVRTKEEAEKLAKKYPSGFIRTAYLCESTEL